MQMQHLQGQKAAQINGMQMSTSVRHKCRVVGAQSLIGSGLTLRQPGEARTGHNTQQQDEISQALSLQEAVHIEHTICVFRIAYILLGIIGQTTQHRHKTLPAYSLALHAFKDNKSQNIRRPANVSSQASNYHHRASQPASQSRAERLSDVPATRGSPLQPPPPLPPPPSCPAQQSRP